MDHSCGTLLGKRKPIQYDTDVGRYHYLEHYNDA